MAAAVDTARACYLMAARKRDAGRPFIRDAAVAKLVATDTAMKVTTDAVQVLGGYGYTRDFPAERFMREAKVTQIFEGTNQIQRLVIGRQLLPDHRREADRRRRRPGHRRRLGAGRGDRALGVAAGASAVIMDLPSSPGGALADELGERVRFAAADVRDEGQVQAGIQAARDLGVLRVAVELRRGGHARPGDRQARAAAAGRLPHSGRDQPGRHLQRAPARGRRP